MNTETEILHFIKEKEQTGALLLTGQWGSGKSYLLKEFAKKTNKKDSEYYITCGDLIANILGYFKECFCDSHITI